MSVIYSTQVVEQALERQAYAKNIEDHANTLKQIILSEDIYENEYNTDKWQVLENKFNEILLRVPLLTPRQQTLNNSIKSQHKNIIRIFNVINQTTFNNINKITKEHFKTRLITQIDGIRIDSIQLYTFVKKDIEETLIKQVLFILTTMVIVIIILIYSTFRLLNVFQTSLNEVESAFNNNHSGSFQTIQLTNNSEEFESIAKAFNSMNKKLSETTVSLESMKKIVDEKTEKLEALSNTDPLTQVANRRALFERGNLEMFRAKRNESQLTIALLDCDHFKNINDSYGHLFGDKVLKHLSHICSEGIRKVDFFARYGGEEFIIIFPDCGINGAIETVKRIQKTLTKSSLSHEEIEIFVQISIGLCTLSSIHENFEQLIKDADSAMYKAKQRGRNRIEVSHNSNDESFINFK